ncbi:PAS and ANTAR domain-containing protein [Nocardioides sp. GCM10027113]|uniref:PAS and ANTAR domain-containing protein n=1 Tax=unclassified Nocardioides TaxID=2615069 RepID=UPI0036070F0A
MGEILCDRRLVARQSGLVGVYVWRVRQDRWWWSEDLYRIHGFEPGEVVPTTSLLVAHQHPDDLVKVWGAIGGALRDGGPYSCYHRILDSDRRTRNVVMVGEATADDDGDVMWMRGFVVDLTEQRRHDLQVSITEAVEGATRHRAAIEQAKGALMLTYGLDAETAFEVLRRCSQRANVKLSLLAERLTGLFTYGRGGEGDLLDLIAISAQLPEDEVRALALPQESLGP